MGFENGSQLLKKRAVGVKMGGGVRKWLSAAKKRAVGVKHGQRRVVAHPHCCCIVVVVVGGCDGDVVVVVVLVVVGGALSLSLSWGCRW